MPFVTESCRIPQISLPDRDRELFLRRYWGVETLESLAKQTGLSVSAVHRKLGKLRESLRDHLQKEGIDL